jgi:drug/metabolite transporter (DMT)-like permease
VLIAVLGGLGAAVCWAASALCATSASRQIGAASTLAWVMALGLCLVVVPLAFLGHPGRLSGRTVGLLCLAGFANVAGLQLEYVAFRHVAVGVVTAIASTEGMVATVLSSLFGASLPASRVALLVLITLGVVLAAAHLDPAHAGAPAPEADGGTGGGPSGILRRLNARRMLWTLLVVPVALLFGVTLYCTGRAGAEAPLIWVLLPARLFGTALLAAPLAARRRLRISRRTAPLVAVAALGEVVGLVCYAFGARHQLAVAAVLGSQCATISAVAAFFLFDDRLRRHQVAGVVLVIAGVVTLSALGA